MGKGKIAHNDQFLLFPQCFLPVWRTFCHLHQVQNCCLQTLSVWNSLRFVVWERVKMYCGQRRKCLKSAIFFFSYNVFHIFRDKSIISIMFNTACNMQEGTFRHLRKVLFQISLCIPCRLIRDGSL